MNTRNFISFILILFLMAETLYSQIEYPAARKVEQSDNYFGTIVEDPYRWMEDLNSPELRNWISEENKITFDYLDKIPFRQEIKNRITELYNFEKYGVPFKAGNYYFYFKNDGLQNQSVLYRLDSLYSEPEIFLDPNKFSKDGTVALTTVSPSRDGKYMVLGISESGSDWNEFFVMDIETKEKLTDNLKWIKFSGANWFKDGFYYNRYDEPLQGEELSNKNQNQKVYYHKIGTRQSEDILIYEDKEHPERTFSLFSSEDERFLYLSISQKGSTGNALYYKISSSDIDFTAFPFSEDFNSKFSVIDNTGDSIYLITNFEAPKNKLVLHNPFMMGDAYKEIIKEKEIVLTNANLIGGKLFTEYIKDATERIYIYNLKGDFVKEIGLPALGSVSGLGGKKQDKETFYSFASFTYPTEIYRYDIEGGKSTLLFKPDVKFSSEDFVTEQIFYDSKDGTRIPMFIVYKKGMVKNGCNPTVLYAYGGFNISQLPTFSISRLVMLECGAVFALANIRGGGEYGKKWHEAGLLLNRQNVFDDFISAAEYLIENNYTSPSKLAAQGGSNGGLLVGVVINQRPDLFRVALPAVGVMDMLRFHKFTIGWAWVTEYGSSDDMENFINLYSYSPYHNLKSGVNYPAVLVTTSDHDDRVVPLHSFKYIARLQELYKGENPVLIRVETDAGHSAGKPTTKIINEMTDIISFLFYNLGHNPF
ncbi:MAG: S9 family peptidase [Ignavibacteria bacterium]|nr:S9 family peptidase [Ignavibacteria bacterium]